MFPNSEGYTVNNTEPLLPTAPLPTAYLHCLLPFAYCLLVFTGGLKWKVRIIGRQRTCHIDLVHGCIEGDRRPLVIEVARRFFCFRVKSELLEWKITALRT